MENKEAYVEKMNAQIDQVKSRVDMLRAKAAEGKADANVEMNKQIADLEARMNALNEKKQEIQSASEDKWESLKNQFQETIDQTKAKLEELSSAFTK